MVRLPALGSAALAVLHARQALAHPGEVHDHEKIRREIEQRDLYADHVARSLDKCARSASAVSIERRAIQRRAATLSRLRARAGLLVKRDEAALVSWGGQSHNETADYSSSDDVSTLFGSNTSCVVTPEAVVGPYWVSGELVRSNVVESQSGVPVHLDMQFIDISTCEPVNETMLVDLWHANATGVYSGVSGEGGLDTDFLRGVQATDSDGVVQFDTVFPGHYQGRATHIHLQTHRGASLLENNTYSGGTVTHIGQLFFDETLRSAVEAVQPYAGNSQSVTSNSADSIAAGAASSAYDPFVKYLYLGDSVADGLTMWISIGVDMSADYTSEATPAAYWGEDGGFSSGNSGMPGGGSGGGGGSPGGNGTDGGAPGSAPGGSGGSNGTNTSMGNSTMPSASGGAPPSAGSGSAPSSGSVSGPNINGTTGNSNSNGNNGVAGGGEAAASASTASTSSAGSGSAASSGLAMFTSAANSLASPGLGSLSSASRTPLLLVFSASLAIVIAMALGGAVGMPALPV